MSCSKKYKVLKEQIDTSIEQQETDFDIKNILVELKKNTFFRNNFSKSHQAQTIMKSRAETFGGTSPNQLKKIEDELILEKFETMMLTNN